MSFIHQTALRRLFFASVLVAAALAAGCGGDFGGSCRYDGKIYRIGERFPATDGCNTCSCEAGGAVACTEIACAPSSCLYEGKSYSPGDSFPASDGCNTCTCGDSGAVGCTKIGCTIPAMTTWLVMRPVQCNGNPWQTVTSVGDGLAPNYSDPELLQIDNFFEDKGIDLIELGFMYPPSPEGVCEACSCPRGDYLLVRARLSAVSMLETTYGFTRLGSADGPDGGLGYTPRQCDTNPWTSTTNSMSREEAESAARFTASKAAPVKRIGFIQRSTPIAVCEACTCPRGDRLVGSATGAPSAGNLRGLSFTELPR
jgi:hypothetical protein